MADNLTTQTSTLATIPTSTKISTDEDATNGHVQRMKLAYSADGVSTHVQADADGMLVNLGTNNDVTVTGTVTADLGATDNAVLDNIDTDLTTIAAAVAADAAALGSGILIQGDDGTDRKNINVDATTGDVQVDVTNTVTVDGSGVTQPVSGTVTANLSATDNAVLDSIDSAATAIQTAVQGSLDVSAATVAVSNAGLTELAAAINTSQLDVNIATDSVGIGGGTQYTEDDAAAANPVGTASILVRADTPGTLVSTDGDNVAQRGTNYGAAFTQIVDSSGNFIDTFGGSGGTAAADDADFTAGTTQGTLVQGVYESSPTSVTDGDMGAIGITQTREVRVSIEADNVGIGGGTQYTEDDAAAANPVGNMMMGVRDDALSGQTSTDGDNIAARMTDNGELYVKHTDTVTVDGSGVTQPVSASSLPLPSGASTAANQSTANTALSAIQTAVELIDNTVSGTELQVDVITMPTTTVTGTVTANLGATDNAVLDSIDAAVNGTLTVDLGANNDVTATGSVAHDAADSGNPVKIGGKAKETDGTDPGSVAENDRADIYTDRNGRMLVNGAHPNLWQATGLYSAAQTDASVKAAPGAGLSLYITDIVVSTDTAFNCFFEHGTTKVYGTLYLAANGGASSHFQTPIRIPANTALTFTSSATANHSVVVNGYTAP